MRRSAPLRLAGLAALLSLFVPLVQAPGWPFDGLCAQQVETDTVRGDSARPIPLDPLQVEVLRTSLRMAEVPFAVTLSTRPGSPSPLGNGLIAPALQGLAGLTVLDRHNLSLGESVAIRGQGSRAQFGTRGLHVTVDGAPATLPDGQTTLDHLFLPAFDRIEVLRGPSSALYGNGAGGTIRFRSREPGAAIYSGEGAIVTGSDGTLGIHTLSTGSMGTVGYLLGLGSFETDGFRANPAKEDGTYGGGRRRHFRASVQRPAGAGRLRIAAGLVSLSSKNPGALTRDGLADPTRPANPFFVSQQTGKDLTQTDVSLSWAGSLGPRTAEIVAWGLRRSVDNPIPPRIIDLHRTAFGVNASVAGSFPGPRAPIEWLVGGEIGSQADRRANHENQAGTKGILTLDQREDVLGGGAFGQVSAHLFGDGLFLGSLRYHRVRFGVEDRQVGPENPDDSGTRTMDAWSPSMAISMPLSGGVAARANLSSFFQTPTTTELVNQPSGAGGLNPDLDPVSGWAVEGGIRAVGDDGVLLDASVFSTWVTKELVPFESDSVPGRTFFRNAGSSRYVGLEVAGESPEIHGIQLKASATLLRAEFEEFTLAGEDLSGERVPGNPTHTLEGSATWSPRPAGQGVAGFIQLRGVHQGNMTVDDSGSDRAEAFGLVDLRFGLNVFRFGPVPASMVAEVTNLFDRAHVSAVSINAFGGRFFHPGPGRRFQLSVAVGPSSRVSRGKGP